ncbi:sigma-70 family RNA polymerase sigma factor [Candidatus Woesearchaeota archaeon]|nr:sigma-70 family RNA polymerase sigma factor [Candidatus Woesearchaeota archaeon]
MRRGNGKYLNNQKMYESDLPCTLLHQEEIALGKKIRFTKQRLLFYLLKLPEYPGNIEEELSRIYVSSNTSNTRATFHKPLRKDKMHEFLKSILPTLYKINQYIAENRSLFVSNNCEENPVKLKKMIHSKYMHKRALLSPLDFKGKFLEEQVNRVNKYAVYLEKEKKTVAYINQLAEKYRNARDKLVQSNLRLVIFTAKMFEVDDTDIYPDLIQEGTLGLMDAVDKFDFSLGFHFSTLAVWWIKQKIRQYLRGYDSRVKPVLNNFITYADDDSGEFVSLIPDEKSESPEQIAANKSLSERVLEVIDTLDKRSGDIVKMRFGLDGYYKRTLDEIGALLGLTRARIGQIEDVAIKKLRKYNKKKLLALLD